MDPARRRERLEALADEPNPARRRLVALALVADRLAEDAIEPILVGGAALEVYTHGGYATGDVDLALPNVPEVDRAFADLGFRKQGRFWVREDLDLLFEAPAPAGLPGETSPRTELDVEGLRVVVIGLEDLLLDRLRAAVHWQSLEDRRWARRLVLLHAQRLDWSYLRDKTAAQPAEREELDRLQSETNDS
ncbi:MAG TPA: UbiD family decarboxylase [Thermoanaerobaculia bacterium]|jgi:predicted nucleotidyltransferase|nr:UbiD family decarboxylase [Thermoanaerobaculia bacterium]